MDVQVEYQARIKLLLSLFKLDLTSNQTVLKFKTELEKIFELEFKLIKTRLFQVCLHLYF